MEIKNTFLICLLALFTLTTFVGHASATGASLSIIPSTGTHIPGEVFTVTLKADGGGQAFNAAQATVFIPPILQVQSITLGDCGFAFVKTPTQANLSFAGVILGDSSTSCTVYTLTVQAIQPGTGSITIASGSIKSFKGAQEIFSSSQNAVYVISSGSNTSTNIPITLPTQAPIVGLGGIKLYTIIFHVTPPSGVDPATIKVILDPNKTTPRQVTFTKDASLQEPIIFDKVPQGVHTITTYVNATPVSQQIVAVGGTNRQLIFGISAHENRPYWMWYLLSIFIAVFIGIVGTMLYKEVRKRRNVTTI